MEKVLNLIFNAENVRMLVILAFVCSGYALVISKISGVEFSLNKRIDGVEFSLNKRIDGVETSLNKRIDGVEASIKELRGDMNGRIDELKNNDFAHLNSAIEALTYALEKNGSLKREDKKFVDSRLAH